MDVGSVRQRVALWNKHLPHVSIHYAMKANDNPHLLREMLALGANFDCAS